MKKDILENSEKRWTIDFQDNFMFLIQINQINQIKSNQIKTKIEWLPFYLEEYY